MTDTWEARRDVRHQKRAARLMANFEESSRRIAKVHAYDKQAYDGHGDLEEG